MEVCRGIWKLTEASTEYIRGSCNYLMEAMEVYDITSTDSGNLHVLPRKLPLTSMEVNLLA